jgi:hypothetical protein
VVGVFSRFRVEHPKALTPIPAPLVPNTGPREQVAGCCHRFGVDMPVFGPKIQEFVEFAKAFILKLEPLREGDVPSFEDWLTRGGYPGSRIRNLRKLRQSLKHVDARFMDTKGFVKFESYLKFATDALGMMNAGDPKVARIINSYSDISKVILGPLIHAMDKNTFKCGFFVKGTNPREWPAMLEGLLGTDKVSETDFTSFEAHHHDEFAEIIHFWMMHMVRNVASNSIKRALSRMVKGVNRNNMKWIKASVSQRLMSGALWTSSANGLLNLLILAWISLRAEHPDLPTSELIDLFHTFKGRVEGDDGICKYIEGMENYIREVLGEYPDKTTTLKMEVHSHYSQAKFCGIVCDRDTMEVVTDPLKVLLNFGLCDKRYNCARENVLDALSRSKALSYKVNYNNCPVIGPFCHKVCDLTRSVDVRHVSSEMGAWEHELVDLALNEKVWLKKPEIDMRSRVVVEERYGLAVCEQLRIEEAIHKWSKGPFLYDFTPYCSHAHVEHALTHVVRTRENSTAIKTKVLLADEIMVRPQEKFTHKQAHMDRVFPNKEPPVDLMTREVVCESG